MLGILCVDSFFFLEGRDCIYRGGSFLQLGITKNKFIDMFKFIQKKFVLQLTR